MTENCLRRKCEKCGKAMEIVIDKNLEPYYCHNKKCSEYFEPKKYPKLTLGVLERSMGIMTLNPKLKSEIEKRGFGCKVTYCEKHHTEDLQVWSFQNPDRKVCMKGSDEYILEGVDDWKKSQTLK